MKSRKGDKSNFVVRSSANVRRAGKIGLIPFSAFTLLEIVLSLAILAGALAALGEVMRLGDQNAEWASDGTQAALLAESVMSEILCGARLLENVNNAEFDLPADPPWAYSVAVEPTEYTELVVVTVSVVQQLPPELEPARCNLVRWMPDPDYLSAQAAAQEQAAAQSTTSAGSSAQSTTGG